ncbi:MAG TPA: methyl-accepting chemotaxis protein [Capsulimonadaceae bacterium]|jgi:methyl-accepting chemotaxis protein
MSWFNNLKIAQKLGLSFGICLLLALAAGAVAVTKMASMNANTATIMAGPFDELATVAELRSDMKQYRLWQLRYMLATTANVKASIRQDLSKTADEIDKGIAKYQKLAKDPTDAGNIDVLQQRWQEYRQLDAKFFELGAAADIGPAVKFMGSEAFQKFNSVSDQVNVIVKWTETAGTGMASASNSAYLSAKTLVTILLVIAFIVGCAMAIMVTRAITGVVNEIDGRLATLNSICLANLNLAVEELAKGNLKSEIVTGTTPLTYSSKDEFGTLATSINGMIAKVKGTIDAYGRAQKSLAAMIEHAHTMVIEGVNSLDKNALIPLCDGIGALAQGDLTKQVNAHIEKMPVDDTDFGKLAVAVNSVGARIEVAVENYKQSQAALSNLISQARMSADTIAATSSELASSSEDLSDRTSEQASSLEETASSMEEMTGTVKQNAENAKHANEIAGKARTAAHDGGEIVVKAIASMDEINSSSRRIADIISVIDEIAFQTNLLALNAAVEAARVGEQGRGFAVVASEVRNLAGRSSTAAKEIKALVQDSVRKVQDGTDMVNKSGQQLQEIVAAVNQVAEIVAEISAASQEQSAGIEQVNKAVAQMDEITQQNAALVEEAAGSSQTMSQQARELQQLVGKFKIVAGEGISSAPAQIMGASHEQIRFSKPTIERVAKPKNGSKKHGGLQVVGGSSTDDYIEF